MTIKRLSEKTINLIAAGEVVERPLSVIKELIENSLDSGAHTICIEIERGGRNLISISDDGFGIRRDELAIALERHATSKLNEDDIAYITHHGFRGEALPSIASVSNMTIKSRHVDSLDSWQITIDGSELGEVTPVNHKTGTTVEVKNLFCFTPNRLKFLKPERLEVAAIIDLINRFALYHKDVAFKLISDGKLIINHRLDNDRLSLILGKDFVVHSLLIDKNCEGISLNGHISLPTISRKTSANYYIYVNDRIIRDKFFIGAIKGAYAGLIPSDRYPSIILFLNVDPYSIDVNVHPSKAEIRFRDEALVRSHIISTIREAISSHKIPLTQVEKPSIQEPTQNNLNLNYFEMPTSGLYNHSSFNPINMYEKQREFRAPLNVVKSYTLDKDDLNLKHEDVKSFPLGFAKCQIDNTYIIAQNKEGIVIIDQHAAHERLVLERLKKQFLSHQIKSQSLLIPEIINLNIDQVEKLIEFKEALLKFSFSIERNGLNQIIIHQVPYIFGNIDIKDFLIDLSDNTQLYEGMLNDTCDELLSTIACYSSIRAGRKLVIEEMNAILREMEVTEFAAQCNHGRPTFKQITFKEFKHMFERT